ncbi:MAG: hypothetical protein V1900_04295 [Candidatus Aenigmatarchaeota archaeon]
MAEIRIVDDSLAPQDFISINYQGKEPYAVCTKVTDWLKAVWKVTGIDVYELDIRWDITNDPRTFYGYWRVKKEYDNWTFSKAKVRAQGAQSSKDRTGWLNIVIDGWVETKYEYTNFIQKSFWWFYNYMFYYKQRRMYLEYEKDLINKLKENILRTLGTARED